MPYIGDIYIPAVTEQNTDQERETIERNFVGSSPSVSEFSKSLESGDMNFILNESLHSRGETVEQQREAIQSLLDQEAPENTFEFLKQRGHLAIEDVSLPINPNLNKQEGTISLRFLPDSLYQPGKSFDRENESNDFAINFYGTFTLPKIAKNVRLRSGETGDSIALDLVTIRTDENGNDQEHSLQSEQGLIQPYSSEMFVNSVNADTLSAIGPKYQEDAYGLQRMTLGSSSDYIEHTFTVPDGEYKIVVRTYDGSGDDTFDINGTTVDPTADSSWDIVSATDTASNSSLTVRIDNLSGGGGAWLDYILLIPKNKPQVTFDYPAGDTLDMDADRFWRFNEGSGDTFYDSSPNGGDISDSEPSWSSNSKTGDHSLHFDGNDEIASSYSDINQDFTWSVWFKTDSSSAQRIMGSRNGSDQNLHHLRIDSNEQLEFARTGDGWSTAIIAQTSSGFVTKNWHHVVATYSHSSNEVILYIDGQRIDTDSANIDDLTDPSDIIIGDDGKGEHFNGKIDSPQIYPFVLDQDDVDYLHENPGVELNPLSSYNIDSGQGVRIYDSMGSSAKSNWRRVYDENYQFNGDIVIENGLARVQWRNDYDRIYFYTHKDGSYQNIGFESRYDGSGYNEGFRNERIKSITNSEVVIEYDVIESGGDVQYEQITKLKRGSYFSETIIDFDQHQGHWWKMLQGGLDRNYVYTSAGVVGDYNTTGSTPNGGNIINPFCVVIDEDDDFISFAAASNDDAKLIARNSVMGYLGDSDNLTGKESIWRGAIPFDSTANLFSEAKNTNISSGSAVNHWKMPLSVSGNLAEFTGDTGNFTEDTTNGILEHTNDGFDAIYLNALNWASSESSNHYHWSVQASDTTSDEVARSRYGAQDTIFKESEYRAQLDFTNNTIDIGVYDSNGNFTVIARDSSFSLSYGVLYHYEVEWDVSNGVHNFYVWQDGNGKPGSPTISGTDSTWSSGQVGYSPWGSVDLHAFEVNAEEVTSSGNSAVIIPMETITGGAEMLTNQVTAGIDIPLGIYITAARMKQTNAATNNKLQVYNSSSNNLIDIDGGGASQSKSVTNSYEFYTRSSKMDADDKGDTVRLPRVDEDSTTDVSHIIVDEVIQFPISLLQGGNQLGPQDLAFQSLTDSGDEKQLFQR